ncbi:hypothetical protein NT04LM_2827, partial [Listeria monocytogenes FSL F2-208]
VKPTLCGVKPRCATTGAPASVRRAILLTTSPAPSNFTA